MATEIARAGAPDRDFEVSGFRQGASTMALSVGTGPFGDKPGGVFNFELPRPGGILYFEKYPRRIRAVFGSQTVVDSKRVKLLHETGHLPVFYFPKADVRLDLLERSLRTSHCPLKGDATYWSIRSGERSATNAAWSYEEPIDSARGLAGHLAFYWDPIDKWLEEDEEIFGHARDPYHRIDVLDTSRKLRISVRGEVVAETSHSR